MGYEYTNPKRASDTHALPNVEIFHVTEGEWWIDADGNRHDAPRHDNVPCEAYETCDDADHKGLTPCAEGFYFAFGFPGCLWDSEPSGPYETYEAALEAARESSGDEEEDEEEP